MEEEAGVMERLVEVVVGAEGLLEVVRVATIIASTAFLLLSFATNLYIIINICYKKRIQVCYFLVFLVISLLHTSYFAATLASLLFSPCSPLLPLLPTLDPSLHISPEQGCREEGEEGEEGVLPPTSRAALGAIFLTVAALTVERFLSSSLRTPWLRTATSLLFLLTALTGPALTLAFRVLTDASSPLSMEVWFGVEVAVYVILPLLTLTVFGTVNYCRVSLTNRLLPTHQVQAVKLNIGVTVTANLAIFLFLVERCLALWLHQLLARGDRAAVGQVMDLVEVALLLCTVGVGGVLLLLPLLYLCTSSSCTRGCCCPAINQLEEVEVRYTVVASEEAH